MRLFVGSLCRHFAADEAQAADRVAGIESWREELRKGLGERAAGIEDWSEDPAAPVEGFELGGVELRGLRLLAVYAQRSELEWPDLVPAEPGEDQAFADALAEDFRNSHYGQLLAVDCWLPGRFDYSFRCPRPDGEEAGFGSLLALVDQLGFLNARTLQLDRSGLAAFQSATEASFIAAAARGLAVFLAAVEVASERGLPLLLDPGQG